MQAPLSVTCALSVWVGTVLMPRRQAARLFPSWQHFQEDYCLSDKRIVNCLGSEGLQILALMFQLQFSPQFCQTTFTLIETDQPLSTILGAGTATKTKLIP